APLFRRALRRGGGGDDGPAALGGVHPLVLRQGQPARTARERARSPLVISSGRIGGIRRTGRGEPGGRCVMNANKVRAIFMELVDQVSPEQWDGRLAELARDDQELRAKVAALLAAHRQADSFLERPAAPLAETVDAPASPEASGAGTAPAQNAGVVL